ncbi:MAG: zf-HC2 domain-containing protein [Defluviitaleaceae bacterium]|nr:zf-HC2 domain-containing protein [Defluviitaleaceae bacterium]
MKCHIAKDLLPNYIDGLTGEETSAEIKAHLEECTDCNAVYTKMTTEISKEKETIEINIDFLVKLKNKLYWTFASRAVVVTAIVLVALLIFGFFYEITVPFSEEKMWVEISRAAHLELFVNEYESIRIRWRELEEGDELEYGEKEIHELVLRWQGFSRRGTYMYGRNIIRDGGQVRVVFFSFTERPVNRLIRGVGDWNMTDGSSWGHAMHGGYLGPQTIEVYYFPNLHRLTRPTIPLSPHRHDTRISRFSDGEIDALRSDATLVWHGEVGLAQE